MYSRTLSTWSRTRRRDDQGRMKEKRFPLPRFINVPVREGWRGRLASLFVYVSREDVEDAEDEEDTDR